MLNRRNFIRTTSALAASTALPGYAFGQSGPLRLEITEGVIEPLPFALPTFLAVGGAEDAAADVSRVIAADLRGTGLFRQIPPDAYISQITNFGAPVAYPDWQAINAQALITGQVEARADGQLVVRFRLFDVFSQAPLGEGLQFVGPADSWRRMAHTVADQVYSRITGEGGYFDTRVAFIAEEGPKNARLKRLAIMDYDGANVQFLTDSRSIVLAPRFSPQGDRILYTSYESGFPQVYIMDVATVQRRPLEAIPAETMTFSPRFSPSGQSVVFSLVDGSNTDIYSLDLATGTRRQLTQAPSIETAPSFSPDGSQIVFESDRSGNQQIYIMPADGGEARRVSAGTGRYGTPVWSPRGDYIAFTKQENGRFHIGVMRTDGSDERLLTSSFLDEGPTWAPNGRVIMFTRETPGDDGAPAVYSVDISGRNLQRVATPGMASDPAWSPLQS
ncbi:Tol-Pal system beta propeller repeat protein TolB [Jannaschia sp. CCS1]|uniref:Tol-Pal system protein TolB n=1 Tax=Jannaschia sp. (strain CCS1) TaxID=290400 RepID=TOLB_JANSC|nr:Tol-Pal system beta propeller repeat protein TolB [Jannaschia sp. CCS1]Q28TS0.1 RecName: Full=Tol-Pal system protein TolB; Flags: Precursor [Jannaschia sp. CCS1]ABD53892.1 Twin-arginine translocation pathway signal [Jannaschia sp. CCS1]